MANEDLENSDIIELLMARSESHTRSLLATERIQNLLALLADTELQFLADQAANEIQERRKSPFNVGELGSLDKEQVIPPLA